MINVKDFIIWESKTVIIEILYNLFWMTAQGTFYTHSVSYKSKFPEQFEDSEAVESEMGENRNGDNELEDG